MNNKNTKKPNAEPKKVISVFASIHDDHYSPEDLNKISEALLAKDAQDAEADKSK